MNEFSCINQLTRNGWQVTFEPQGDDTKGVVVMASKGDVHHRMGFVNEPSMLTALQDLARKGNEE